MGDGKESIILIGGGGHCHSVIDVIEQHGQFRIAGIIDVEEKVGHNVLGYPIFACDKQLEALFATYKYALITVGHLRTNRLRREMFERLLRIGYCIPTIVSPLAYVSRYASVGIGTVVMHHALVNANAHVGDNCIINTKALVEHDARVEDHCHISTAAVINGGVTVGENTFVGSNATTKEGVEIFAFTKAGTVAK